MSTRLRGKTNFISRMASVTHLLAAPPIGYPCCLEIGCGKGSFILDMAKRQPDRQFVALERNKDALLIALERAAAETPENLRFIQNDAQLLPELFAPQTVEHIYINFCDPWPKRRQAHRRLTAPAYLKLYRTLLKPNGRLFLRTDNCALFDWSLSQFADNGWQILSHTHDRSDDGSPMTDYEKKFRTAGVGICDAAVCVSPLIN